MIYIHLSNKANLSDLIAVTVISILLKLDSNHRFFSAHVRLTLKSNRATFLYYVKLDASFQIHWWIETGVTVWKCSIRVKIGNLLSCVILKFDGYLQKTIWHLLLRLYYVKLCASSQSHGWIQTGATVWKHSIWVKISRVLSNVTLKYDKLP